MENHQKELCKILFLDEKSSWASIYASIGMLQERAIKAPTVCPTYTPPSDLGDGTGTPLPNPPFYPVTC